MTLRRSASRAAATAASNSSEPTPLRRSAGWTSSSSSARWSWPSRVKTRRNAEPRGLPPASEASQADRWLPAGGAGSVSAVIRIGKVTPPRPGRRSGWASGPVARRTTSLRESRDKRISEPCAALSALGTAPVPPGRATVLVVPVLASVRGAGADPPLRSCRARPFPTGGPALRFTSSSSDRNPPSGLSRPSSGACSLPPRAVWPLIRHVRERTRPP